MDIPVTAIRVLKDRLKGRTLLMELDASDPVRGDPPGDSCLTRDSTQATT